MSKLNIQSSIQQHLKWHQTRKTCPTLQGCMKQAQHDFEVRNKKYSERWSAEDIYKAWTDAFRNYKQAI